MITEEDLQLVNPCIAKGGCRFKQTGSTDIRGCQLPPEKICFLSKAFSVATGRVNGETQAQERRYGYSEGDRVAVDMQFLISHRKELVVPSTGGRLERVRGGKSDPTARVIQLADGMISEAIAIAKKEGNDR